MTYKATNQNEVHTPTFVVTPKFTSRVSKIKLKEEKRAANIMQELINLAFNNPKYDFKLLHKFHRSSGLWYIHTCKICNPKWK